MNRTDHSSKSIASRITARHKANSNKVSSCLARWRRASSQYAHAVDAFMQANPKPSFGEAGRSEWRGLLREACSEPFAERRRARCELIDIVAPETDVCARQFAIIHFENMVEVMERTESAR